MPMKLYEYEDDFYPAKDLAAKKGVSVSAVHKASQRGTLHNLGKGKGKGVTPYCVTIRGHKFNDVNDCHQQTGLSKKHIYHMIALGKFDDLGKKGKFTKGLEKDK